MPRDLHTYVLKVIIDERYEWAELRCFLPPFLGTPLQPIIEYALQPASFRSPNGQRIVRRRLIFEWLHINLNINLRVFNESQLSDDDTEFEFKTDTYKYWDLIVGLVGHKMNSEILTRGPVEVIYMAEHHIHELLSQPQAIKSKSFASRVSLWASLVDGFDTVTISLGLTSLLVPVLVVLMLKSHSLYCRNKSVIQTLRQVWSHGSINFCSLIALMAGDTSHQWDTFFMPLMHKARIRLTKWSVALLAISTLYLALLYGQLFNADLLTKMLFTPTQLIETFENLVKFNLHDSNYNVSILSTGDKMSLMPYFWPFLETNEAFKLVQRLWNINSEDKFQDSDVIIITTNTGCSFMLTDPLWKIKSITVTADTQ